MKKPSVILISSFILLVAVIFLPISVGERGADFKIVPPKYSMEFDEGMDVRNKLGRPVKSFKAKQELKMLFVGGLYNLFTSPSFPVIQSALKILDKSFNMAGEAITRFFVGILKAPVQAVLLAVRRFKKIITAEKCKSLMFGTFATLLLVFWQILPPISYRIAPTILRC